MTGSKPIQNEREYIIPLRKVFLKVPRYKRTSKAIKEIKLFIAKHMKVPDRDTSKVKLDVYFNNQFWFRGRRHPPAKIKVKARKEGDNVIVDFVEIPQHIQFLRKKQERFHKKTEKKKEEPTKETFKEEKKEEDKKEEKEKEQAVAEQHTKEAKQDAKVQKHLTKVKEPAIRRLALKK